MQLPLLPAPATLPTLDRLGPATVSYVEAKSLLSPATGRIRGAFKFTLNPYNGCGFGCSYCYARFFAPTPEDEAAWGTWIRVKENALSLLHRAARSTARDGRLEPGDSILMSSVTDPYQPVERRLELTRSIVEALVDLRPKLTVQTRSPIVVRDIDLLRQLPGAKVNLSVPTDSEDIRLRYEPHAPAIEARLAAARAVAAAGIPVQICVSPMLPIRDPDAFGRRIAETGARSFVSSYFHQAKVRFASSTPDAVFARLAEDRWSHRAYEAARRRISAGLGDRGELREWWAAAPCISGRVHFGHDEQA